MCQICANKSQISANLLIHMELNLASEAKGRGFDPRQPHQICRRAFRGAKKRVTTFAVRVLPAELNQRGFFWHMGP
jgi:hypothetical protein